MANGREEEGTSIPTTYIPYDDEQLSEAKRYTRHSFTTAITEMERRNLFLDTHTPYQAAEQQDCVQSFIISFNMYLDGWMDGWTDGR